MLEMAFEVFDVVAKVLMIGLFLLVFSLSSLFFARVTISRYRDARREWKRLTKQWHAAHHQ